MAHGPETTFIAGVHRHLPVGLYRMKNHNEYNGGIADCWYSGEKSDLWVEYKHIVVPKRPDTLIDLCAAKNPALSPLQQKWLRDRLAEGRSVRVIVGSPEGGVILSDLAWELPMPAKKFRELALTRKEIAEWIATYTC